ncbi:MAG: malonyl-CoA decarboxylase [Hyphomicrobiaceae bacterium]|nr:malonyl-CoA decarboxylase [Hyphomicrobiaceae bacterium]
MNVSFFQELLNSIAERGRSLLEGSAEDRSAAALKDLAGALLSERGEASGVALAGEILSAYRRATDEEKLEFFRFLFEAFTPDEARVTETARDYLSDPSPAALSALEAAVGSPRQEFFRRLNLAPGATRNIVALRQDLLRFLPKAPDLAAVDTDLMHLLASWFNRGFLVLRRIDWSTSASTLEKIIEYEAVHEIRGWEDLRRRLDPADRRCFGFFHPSLVDEPLIFVEVALTDNIPASIQELLAAKDHEAGDTPKKRPTTAVFYSISNCQKGLQGISFGNFLIKQVVEDLAKEIPSLKTFVTLSPAPRFAAWIVRATSEHPEMIDRETLDLLSDASWAAHAENQEHLKETLMPLAAEYFLTERTRNGRPVDPVARFHLGNGARLERINWLGDKSAKGLRQSHGIMVNYLYDLGDIEPNHEAYVNDGTIAASKSARSLLSSSTKQKTQKKRRETEIPENATVSADE